MTWYSVRRPIRVSVVHRQSQLLVSSDARLRACVRAIDGCVVLATKFDVMDAAVFLELVVLPRSFMTQGDSKSLQ